MDEALEEWIPVAILIALVLMGVLGLPAWLRALRSARVTVDETQFGLLVHKGLVTRDLAPGVYSTFLRPNDRIETFDRREQTLTVPGQETLTADHLSIKTTLLVRHRIADARAYRQASGHPLMVLYEDVQVLLRARTAKMTLDALLADREALTRGLAEELDTRARKLGMQVSAAEIRDLTLAGAAKQAFADLWKAQKEGQAALERARGEQASLRSLANAARMLKGNPELMNLRLLQALAAQPGKAPPTVVLGGGAGLLPVRGEGAVDPPTDAEG